MPDGITLQLSKIKVAQLVMTGIDFLKQRGASGCVLLGEAEFYSRFGFKQNTSLTLPDAPEEFFLALPLNGEIPSGTVEYHEVFAANS
jgi:putative acetyltransferase